MEDLQSPKSNRREAQQREQSSVSQSKSMSSKTLEQGFYDSGSPISLSYSSRNFNTLSWAKSHSQSLYSVGKTLTSEPFFIESFVDERDEQNPNSQLPAKSENTPRNQISVVINAQPDRQPPREQREDKDESTDISTFSRQTDPITTPENSRQSPVQRPETEEAVVARDDQFEADLRDILAGKKRYDAQQKQAIPVAEARTSSAQSNPQTGSSTSNPDNSVKNEFEKNEHAIFDKIAQSMKLSTAYDLGSIALDNRFDAFDAEYDHLDEKKK